MSQGMIYNIQRMSVQDGPGLRTTVFLKGCPLRCLWCSNPESQQFTPQMLLFDNLCVSCGACAQVCPNGAVVPLERWAAMRKRAPTAAPVPKSVPTRRASCPAVS